MTLYQLRKSLKLHETRRVRANKKYKAAQKGSASAVYWLAKRKIEWRLVQRRQKQIGRRVPSPRESIRAVALKAMANFHQRPGLYHYLAGGVPNSIVLSPTPRNYRSDCSQFVAGVYRAAGVKCPGSGTYTHSNTVSMANGGGGRLTHSPKPGDLAMYGARYRPHHVELVVGTNPLRYVGHGTARIDGLTPGAPSFFLTFPQLQG